MSHFGYDFFNCMKSSIPLSNFIFQMDLVAEICINKSSCDCDIGSKKSTFLTTQGKFENQYFSNQRCEIVKKIIFAQPLHVFYSDELKNACYTNTDNLEIWAMLTSHSRKKMMTSSTFRFYDVIVMFIL